MKSEISQNEYLQLVGLMTLTKIHEQNVIECRGAMHELLGIEIGADFSGHIDDEIWGRAPSCDADALLKRLNVSVQPKAAGNG